LLCERLEERLVLTPIFFDSFETAPLSNWWIPDLPGEGRVEIRDLSQSLVGNPVAHQFTQNGNSNSLVFDSTSGGNRDQSVAILTLDLSDRTDAMLTFHELEENREKQELAPIHQTADPGDGLAVSNDGVTWYRLENIKGKHFGEVTNRDGRGVWQLHEYDLRAEVDRINDDHSANLQFTSSFRIKFSQYAESTFPADGWAIDNLKIFDEPQYFDTSLERGAFHRLDLPGENWDEFVYRVAMIGDVDADTPILVSVHGSSRNIYSDTHRWLRFADDSHNGVSDLIVIAPWFAKDERYKNYNDLSWNDSNNDAADKVLLDVIDQITAADIGKGDQFYLWGFSAGGQFTQRFGLAHPDRLAASVVGGPASHAQPFAEVPFEYGIGPNPNRKPPSGVSLDPDKFLPSRIMYWVGQEDKDPAHDKLDNSGQAKAQGEARLQRSANTFEAMHRLAEQRNKPRNTYEYELFVSEGDGHTFGQSDFAEWYEFLFRDYDANEQPLLVHPRVVLTPTDHERQATLPQGVSRIEPSTDFYLELWVQAPAGQALGIKSGAVEIYFDTTRADVVSLDHGSIFDTSASGVVYENDGRVRELGGTTSLAGVGVGEFALFGRIRMRTASHTGQLSMAVQRDSGSWQLEGGPVDRSDLLPVSRVDVGSGSSANVQGIVFHDANGNGDHDSTELGLTDREIRLLNTDSTQATHTLRIEPDDYDPNPPGTPEDEKENYGRVVNRVISQAELSAVGSEVVGESVFLRREDDTESPGEWVFAHQRSSGWKYTWKDGSRELRVDFTNPTTTVSIDAIAKVDDDHDVGMLEIFDSDGNQLGETYVTEDLLFGEVETMTLNRPQGDIAYAVASGHGSNSVLLDNLRFESEIRTVTDADGGYILDQIPPGTYKVDLTATGGWITSAPLTGQYSIAVAAGDVVANKDFGSRMMNEPPTAVIATPSPASLAENTSTSNSVKVADISITDDGLGTNTLSLSGTDASSFTLVGSELHVAAGVSLDFETKPSYSVTVSVDDTTVGSTPDASVGFTLNLTDVNDNAPVITTAAAQSVAEGTALVAALTSTDLDTVGTNPATFTITGGADQGLFEIDVSGNLVFKAAKDYETDAHSYTVEVTADDGANTRSKTITVNLTDVNEAPTAVILTPSPASVV